MRLTGPRIRPVDESAWHTDLEPLLDGLRRAGRGGLNLMGTLANHPKLMRRFLVFGNHILAKSTLPARERELIILRTGYLCRAGYEWTHHVLIVEEAGLSLDVREIAVGPESSAWSADDRHLLDAVDQLVGDQFVTDSTWAALAKRWGPEQLLDIVFTVGQYTMVSMALNSLGVQLEEGIGALPPQFFGEGQPARPRLGHASGDPLLEN